MNEAYTVPLGATAIAGSQVLMFEPTVPGKFKDLEPRAWSAPGVVREALPVDHHARIVTDDPRVVPGRDHREVAGPELHLLPVVHDYLHPARDEVAHVRCLTAVGLRDRLDVL